MATEIDNKVVTLQFDNKQFEQGVSETVKSLEKLKDSLDMKGATQSLNNLERQIDQFDVGEMNNAAKSIGDAFTRSGQVVQATIQRMTNDVISFGRSVTRHMIGPMRDGMATYEERIKSTQITMNALGVKGRAGQKYVTQYLNDLNKYSDDTIYKFSDMTTSLSKFVSAGVDVNTATKAIKGLGNAAALSGASTADFSRAIYNVSQALGSGKMMTRDWMSIENANMATKEFKQTLIDTATQMGVLDKEGHLTAKGLANINSRSINSAKATTVTYKNLRDTLSTGWLTSDVLMKTLNNYADETTELGKKGKAAATEVKTFSQLLDTLGDSLATKWSNIYTSIVGDYYDAKELWTGVSNVLDTLLVKPLEKVQKYVEKWNELGGRSDILNGLKMQLIGFKAAFKYFKMGWESVFPKSTQNLLYTISTYFAKFSYYFATFINQHGPTIVKIGRGIAAVIKIALVLLQDSLVIIAPVLQVLGSVAEVVLTLTGDLAELIAQLMSGTKVTDAINIAFGSFGASLNKVADKVSGFFHGLAEGLQSVVDIKDKLNFGKGLDIGYSLDSSVFKEAAGYGASLTKVFTSLGKAFLAVVDLIVKGFTQIAAALTRFNNDLSNALVEFAADPVLATEEAIKEIKSLLSNFGSFLKNNVFANIASFLQNGGITKTIDKIVDDIKFLGKSIDDFVNKIPEIAQIKQALGFKIDTNGMKNAIGGATDALSKHAKTIDTSKVSINSAAEAIEYANKQMHNSANSIKEAGVNAKNFRTIWDQMKDGLGAAGKNVKNGFIAFGGGAKDVFGKIGGFFAKVGHAIATFFSAVNKEVQQNGGWINVLTRLYRTFIEGGVIDKIASSVLNLTKSLKTFVKGLNLTQKAQAKLIKAKAMHQKAMALKELAEAVLILAGAVMLLSYVKPDRLWSSVGAVIALVGAVTAAVTVMSLVEQKMRKVEKAAKGWKGLFGHTLPDTISGGIETIGQAIKNKLLGVTSTESMSKKMISLSVSVGILTASLYVLSKLDLKQTAKGLLYLAGVVIILAGAMAVMGKIDAQMQQSAKDIEHVGGFWQAFKDKLFGKGGRQETFSNKLLKLAITISILAGSVYTLSQIPWDQLNNGVTAVGALIILMVGASAALAYINKTWGKAGLNSFLFLSVAMNLLIKPIEVLGSMDLNQLKQGLLSLAAAMMEYVVIMAMIKRADIKGGTMLAFAGALAILAPALLTMAGALALLSLTDPVKMAGATAALILVMASFAGILQSLTKQMQASKGMMGLIPVFAASLDLLGIAFIGFAAAIGALSLIKPEKMIASTAALILVVGIFGELLVKLSTAMQTNQSLLKMIPLFAISIKILSRAMVVMAVAFAKISRFDPLSILSSFVAFAGIMVTFADSSITLGNALKKNKWIFASMATIIAAMYALAPAVDMLTDAFGKISKVDSVGVMATGTAISELMMTLAIAGSLYGGALKATRWAALAAPLLAGSMVILGPAIDTMAEGFSKIAKIDPKGVLATGTAISEIMMTLAVASGIFGKMVEKSKWAILAMPLLAESMNILAPALSELGDALQHMKGVKPGDVGMMSLSLIAIMGVLIGLSSVAGLFAKKVPLLLVALPELAIVTRILAPALGQMADACAKFNKVDWGGIGKMTVAFLALAGIAAGLSIVMSFFPVAIAALPVLAISLGLIVGPLEKLSKLLPNFQKVHWNNIGKLCVSLLALGGGCIVAAAGLIAMAGAVATMGAALNGNGRVMVDILQSNAIPMLVNQLSALTALSAGDIILTLLSLSGGMITLAAGMLALSGAVATMGAALNGNGKTIIQILNSNAIPMLTDQLTALVKLSAGDIILTLLSLSGGLVTLSAGLLALSGGVATMGAALNSNGKTIMDVLQNGTIPMLVDQITSLTKLSAGDIVLTLISLAGGLVVLSASLVTLSGGVATMGAALNANGQAFMEVLQSNAIPMLTEQVTALTKIAGGAILGSLAGLGGGLIVLSLGLLTLSGAVATMGAALNSNDRVMLDVIEGNVIPTLVNNIKTLNSIGGGGLIGTLSGLAGGLVVLSPAIIIFTAAMKACDLILGKARNHIIQYVDALSTMTSLIQTWYKDGEKYITKIVQLITEASYTIPEAVVDAIDNVTESITARAPEIVRGITSIVKSLDKEIAKVNPQYRARVQQILNNGQSTILQNIPAYARASQSLGKGMSTGMRTQRGGFLQSAWYVVAGFFANIGSFIRQMAKMGVELASGFLNAFNNRLGIHSPAWEMIKSAFQSIAGFVKGIASGKGNIISSGVSMAETFLGSVRKKLFGKGGMPDIGKEITKMAKGYQGQINDLLPDMSFDTGDMDINFGTDKATYTKKATTVNGGGEPGYVIERNGKYWKTMSKSDYKVWSKQQKKGNDIETDINKQLKEATKNIGANIATPSSGGGSTGIGSSGNKKSGSSGKSKTRKTKSNAASSKDIKASKWGNGKIPKDFEPYDLDWYNSKLPKKQKKESDKAYKKRLKEFKNKYVIVGNDVWKKSDYKKFSKTYYNTATGAQYRRKDKESVLFAETNGFIKSINDNINPKTRSTIMNSTAKTLENIGLSAKSSTGLVDKVFTNAYSKTDEYKDNVAKINKDEQKITDKEAEVTSYIKQNNDLKSKNAAIDKEIAKQQKIVDGKAKGDKKKAKERIKALKAEKEQNQKIIDANKKGISDTTSEINDLRDEVSDLGDAIKEGPNKMFKEMYDNIKNSVTEATKLSSLSYDGGINPFSQFQYNGSWKRYHNGTAGKILGGYASTQARGYQNYIDDLKWLDQTDFGDDVKQYFHSGGFSTADDLHALRYAIDAEGGTHGATGTSITSAFATKHQANKDTLLQSAKDKVSNIKKWSSNLMQLAAYGMNADYVKELIDDGYSDDSLALSEALLDAARAQDGSFDEFKVSSKTLADDTAKSGIAAYILSYANGHPELLTDAQKAEITQTLGKLVGADAASEAVNAFTDPYYAKLNALVDPTQQAAFAAGWANNWRNFDDQQKAQLLQTATENGTLTVDAFNAALEKAVKANANNSIANQIQDKGFEIVDNIYNAAKTAIDSIERRLDNLFYNIPSYEKQFGRWGRKIDRDASLGDVEDLGASLQKAGLIEDYSAYLRGIAKRRGFDTIDDLWNTLTSSQQQEIYDYLWDKGESAYNSRVSGLQNGGYQYSLSQSIVQNGGTLQGAIIDSVVTGLERGLLSSNTLNQIESYLNSHDFISLAQLFKNLGIDKGYFDNVLNGTLTAAQILSGTSDQRINTAQQQTATAQGAITTVSNGDGTWTSTWVDQNGQLQTRTFGTSQSSDWGKIPKADITAQSVSVNTTNSVKASGNNTKPTVRGAAKAVTEAGKLYDNVNWDNVTPVIAPITDMSTVNAGIPKITSLMTNSSAQLADQIRSQLTINKQIQDFNAKVDYDDSNLISEIQAMHKDMIQMEQAMSNMRVMLDGRTLVGAITPEVDKELGKRSNQRGGWH